MNKRIGFEIGQTYKHTSGKLMKVVGMAQTHFHGECLIGEEGDGGLYPVGFGKEHAINWKKSRKTY